MKLWTNLLVALLVVGLAGVAMAKKAPGDKPVVGAVVSVAEDGKSVVVSVKGKNGAADTEKTIAVGDKVAVTVDGAAGDIKGVKKGMRATITVDAIDGKATKIDVKAKGKGKAAA